MWSLRRRQRRSRRLRLLHRQVLRLLLRQVRTSKARDRQKTNGASDELAPFCFWEQRWRQCWSVSVVEYIWYCDQFQKSPVNMMRGVVPEVAVLLSTTGL